VAPTRLAPPVISTTLPSKPGLAVGETKAI
jgi:hypothetical protein